MDNDESKAISAKTWARTADVISKEGFKNGASDGQKISYQTSFDLGYEQGLHFGIDIGLHDAYKYYSNDYRGILSSSHCNNTQNVNCQICNNGVTPQQNIMNLYNIQKESNEQYSSQFQTII